MAGTAKPCTDHLGNEYPSKNAMCRAYGITKSILKGRLAAGKTLEQALTAPGERGPCRDHTGKEYESKTEMCDAYGIAIACFDFRISRGYGLERALTEPVGKKESDASDRTDHTGKVYASTTKMCAAWNISPGAMRGRLARGYTLEQALSEPANSARTTSDHEGTVFRTTKAMCRHWHVDDKDYGNRKHAAMRKSEPCADILQKVISDAWPGRTAGPYKILRCVRFPWFLCEEQPSGIPLILRADKLRDLMQE